MFITVLQQAHVELAYLNIQGQSAIISFILVWSVSHVQA